MGEMGEKRDSTAALSAHAIVHVHIDIYSMDKQDVDKQEKNKNAGKTQPVINQYLHFCRRNSTF